MDDPELGELKRAYLHGIYRPYYLGLPPSAKQRVRDRSAGSARSIAPGA